MRSRRWKAFRAQDVDALALVSQQRADAAIKDGHFNKSLVPVYREDGSLALDKRRISAAADDAGSAVAAEAGVPGDRRLRARRQGHDLSQADPRQVSRPRDQPRASRRQFVRRGRRLGGDAAGVARLREEARAEAARARRGDGQHGRLADADAERAGAGGAQGAGQGGPDRSTTSTCGRSTRPSRWWRRNSSAT